MIKHPENCGINHGSRCSCGMSELQAECDRLKEKNKILEADRKSIKFHRDGLQSIADRLAEVVDKEYINMDDVNTAYEALKSYDAVKGE